MDVREAPPDEQVAGSLERVYREHGARLWRAVLMYGGDREVASDAVAEAFAQALHRGSAIRSVERWVWRAAFRIAAGELKRRRETWPAETEAPDEIPESFAVLGEALGRLSPKQRAAVILHHYAGYSLREVAAIIGSTASAVGVHLHRARRRLRQLLEEDHDA
jgi:RNA polymerase sigma factor (sigma-70 family)